jgi:hypothetical protein
LLAAVNLNISCLQAAVAAVKVDTLHTVAAEEAVLVVVQLGLSQLQEINL